MDALETIAPKYVIISAPTSKESQFDHPHKDAVKLYEDEVGKDNVLHTGENHECLICDVLESGDVELKTDTKLVDEYGLGKDDDSDKDKKKESKSSVPARVAAPAVITGTRVDQRPMGSK